MGKINIILEGPDCGGKSTLGDELVRQIEERKPTFLEGIRVSRHHHGPYLNDPQPFPRYLASLLNPTDVTIMDRSWLSEPIYGRAYRDGADRLGSLSRMLERVALGATTLVVVCKPEFRVVARKWADRKGEEYLQSERALREVYDGYHPENLRTDLRTIYFDYRTHSLQETASVILKELICGKSSGTFFPHTEGTLGSHQPKVVLLGERANGDLDLPFVNLSGCSPWLVDQLEQAGVRERDLAWMNVQDPNGKFKPLSYLHDHLDAPIEHDVTIPHFVALGRVAQAWCEHHGLPHRRVAHPQWWKRFHHAETYPLIDVLKELL